MLSKTEIDVQLEEDLVIIFDELLDDNNSNLMKILLIKNNLTTSNIVNNTYYIPDNVINKFIKFLASKTIETLTFEDIPFDMFKSIIENHVGYKENYFKSINRKQWIIGDKMIDTIPIVSERKIGTDRVWEPLNVSILTQLPSETVKINFPNEKIHQVDNFLIDGIVISENELAQLKNELGI